MLRESLELATPAMLLFPGCYKIDATAIIHSKCKRDSQENHLLFFTSHVQRSPELQR